MSHDPGSHSGSESRSIRQKSINGSANNTMDRFRLLTERSTPANPEKDNTTEILVIIAFLVALCICVCAFGLYKHVEVSDVGRATNNAIIWM